LRLAAFFTFGFSFSGLCGALKPALSAASKRAWASFSLNSSSGFFGMSSTPRRCIFCLKPGTTDEHVFGLWLREFFPRTPADTRTHRVTTWGSDRHGKIYAMPQSSIQRGHSGAKKVPYVCAGCNNGWMSRMEARTRPILMPLIQGIMHRISTFDQSISPLGPQRQPWLPNTPCRTRSRFRIRSAYGCSQTLRHRPTGPFGLRIIAGLNGATSPSLITWPSYRPKRPNQAK
jgi:hypothetical protein